MRFAAAGNTVIPAIKILGELGDIVMVSESQHGDQYFIAEQNDNILVADDPVAVLGLVKMYELRGEHWQVSNEELTSLGRDYGLL